MQVTLKKIAEMAQTSSATVSLVLNGKQFHRVSPATRERIQEIAQLLNYQPNLRAQSLVKGKTRNIAVIVNELGNPFYTQYLTALQQLLEKHDYALFPFETYMCVERETRILSWLEQGYFDGGICLELNQFNYDLHQRGKRLPVVYRSWSGSTIDSDNMVRVNYLDAIRDLFCHLAEQGRRKMAITINSRDFSDDPTQQLIRRGLYVQLCEHLPLTIDQGGWIPLPFDVNDNLGLVYERTLEVLKHGSDIDTVLVHSGKDVVAVYKAIADAGRAVGSDIAVATFDRIPLLSYLVPEVTYIMEPTQRIAEALVEELLIRISGGTVPVSACFTAQLVKSASTPMKGNAS